MADSLPSSHEKSRVPRGNDGEDMRERERERESSRQIYRERMSNLPKGLGWTSDPMYRYQGFWYTPMNLEGVMWAQHHFSTPHQSDHDVLLASTPKSGTTCLKALVFSVMNRAVFDFPAHPLLTSNPHQLVPLLEFYFHWNMPFPDDPSGTTPRIFQTHIPFSSLPKSILESRSRILYLCRNPKDVFVSMYFFKENLTDVNISPLSIEDAAEQFCDGVSLFGPFWEHVLGYWRASLERPGRVLFLKYEDLKEDPEPHVKRMAEFLGCPFSSEEEGGGVVREIVRLCSFDSLSKLEVNKNGVLRARELVIETKFFFRKGEVGDWKNHVSPEMAEYLDKIMHRKFAGSGLTFHDS